MNKISSTTVVFSVCVFSFWLLPHSASGQFEVFPDKEEEKVESTAPASNPAGLTPFGATPEDFPDPLESKPDTTEFGTSNFGTASEAGIEKSDPNPISSGPKTILKPRSPTTAGSSNRSKSNSSGFEERFWVYLQANNYRNWSAGPSASTGFLPTSRGGHDSFTKLYMNRTAAGSSQNLPVRSVIVAENFDRQKTLQSISVMYRAKDFSKKSKNWYWVEYDPVGTAKTSGVAKSCIQCHSKASGNDFVFFNQR